MVFVIVVDARAHVGAMRQEPILRDKIRRKIGGLIHHLDANAMVAQHIATDNLHAASEEAICAETEIGKNGIQGEGRARAVFALGNPKEGCLVALTVHFNNLGYRHLFLNRLVNGFRHVHYTDIVFAVLIRRKQQGFSIRRQTRIETACHHVCEPRESVSIVRKCQFIDIVNTLPVLAVDKHVAILRPCRTNRVELAIGEQPFGFTRCRLGDIKQHEPSFWPAFGGIDNLVLLRMPRRMRIVKDIIRQRCDFAGGQVNNKEICLSFLQGGKDDAFAIAIVIRRSDVVKLHIFIIQFEVVRNLPRQNVHLNQVVGVVMLCDKGDSVTIGCPRETPAEPTEVGADFLVFVAKKLSGYPMQPFPCLRGHKDNLKETVIPSDISDDVPTRSPDRLDVMRVFRRRCQIL